MQQRDNSPCALYRNDRGDAIFDYTDKRQYLSALEVSAKIVFQVNLFNNFVDILYISVPSDACLIELSLLPDLALCNCLYHLTYPSVTVSTTSLTPL